MRLSTIAGIAVLTVATAALAQTARTPAEQKNMPANAAVNAAATMADPMGNDAMANMAPANGTGTPPGEKTEPAAPPR